VEKRSLIHRFDFLWSGLDKGLGLNVLGLIVISTVTCISASSGTSVKLIDQARNLALAYSVMLVISRIPPKWLERSAVWI